MVTEERVVKGGMVVAEAMAVTGETVAAEAMAVTEATGVEGGMAVTGVKGGMGGKVVTGGTQGVEEASRSCRSHGRTAGTPACTRRVSSQVYALLDTLSLPANWNLPASCNPLERGPC